VTVSVTATPVAEETMSLISAGPAEVTQSCIVRVDATQRINECDELWARLERMFERRVRLLDRLQGGVDALYRAFRNEGEMAHGYAQLESEHLQALGLLGTAGVLAAATLGSVAMSAYAFASHLRATIILAELYGGEVVGLQGEVRATQMAYTAVTRGYATAAASATGAAAAPTTWELVREKMNAGLTEAKAGMDAAIRLRQALSQACKDTREEIHALQRDIDYTRSRMRGCPDVKIMDEPELRLPVIPEPDDWQLSRG
jgi:hypothetical protein